MKKILAILISLAIFLPNAISAVPCPPPSGPDNGLNLCYPTIGPDGGSTLKIGTDLNKVISWFYYFIVTISGFAAFAMIVFGGFKYLSSAGNPSAIGDAKDQIKSALLGLLLILTSYLILQVINPDLVILADPELIK